jgi:NAD(P)H-nitrite reductase large subunit
MGQAKNRGTYKQRKESKMKEQLKDMNKLFSNKTTQYGMDIFFNNISKKDLSNIAELLNEMNMTMGGNKINWKVNGNYISVFYSEMNTSSEDLLFRLNKNREMFELICKPYNEKYNTSISYDGSEFYLNNANLKEVA